MKRINLLLSEYEENLLGLRTGYSKMATDSDTRSSDAAEVLRYVFRDILKWSAADFENRMTPELIRRLGLTRIVGIARRPDGVRKTDRFFLLSVIYPETARYSATASAIADYRTALAGGCAPPQSTFVGAGGKQVFRSCLKYAINVFLPDFSLRELYAYFSDPRRAAHFLSKTGLSRAARMYYEKPFDAFADAAGKTDENEFWYRFALFAAEWNALDTKRKIKL